MLLNLDWTFYDCKPAFLISRYDSSQVHKDAQHITGDLEVAAPKNRYEYVSLSEHGIKKECKDILYDKHNFALNWMLETFLFVCALPCNILLRQ